MEQTVVGGAFWVRQGLTLPKRAGAPDPLGLRVYPNSNAVGPGGQSHLRDCSLAVIFHIKHHRLQVAKPARHSRFTLIWLTHTSTQVRSARKPPPERAGISLHLPGSVHHAVTQTAGEGRQ